MDDARCWRTLPWSCPRCVRRAAKDVCLAPVQRTQAPLLQHSRLTAAAAAAAAGAGIHLSLCSLTHTVQRTHTIITTRRTLNKARTTSKAFNYYQTNIPSLTRPHLTETQSCRLWRGTSTITVTLHSPKRVVIWIGSSVVHMPPFPLNFEKIRRVV